MEPAASVSRSESAKPSDGESSDQPESAASGGSGAGQPSENEVDRQLADRVSDGLGAGGDPADARSAYMALYDRHAAALAAFVGRIAHGSAVDDITQDVWRRAWENLAKGRLKSPFRAWLLLVARNRVTDSWREAARRRAEAIEGGAEPAETGGAPIDQGLIDEEARAALERCLGRLEGRLDDLVRRRWRGDAYEQICDELGIDHNQAYKAYHKAARQLADCVKRSGTV